MPWPVSRLTRLLLLRGIQERLSLEEIGALVDPALTGMQAHNRLVAEGLLNQWRVAKGIAEAKSRRSQKTVLPSIQRRTNTDVHRYVRGLLEAIGVDYIEEYSLPPYQADFYLPHHRLVVEADSSHTHSRPKDRERDAKIEAIYQVRTLRATLQTSQEQLERQIIDAGETIGASII